MTRHRLIARLVTALLLFMQLSVAAYACPGLATALESSAAMPNTAMDMEGGGCLPLDSSAPNLCLQYGHQDSQANEQGSPLPLLIDQPLLMVIPASELILAAALPEVSREFLAHITAPPPAIRFGVFRS